MPKLAAVVVEEPATVRELMMWLGVTKILVAWPAPAGNVVAKWLLALVVLMFTRLTAPEWPPPPPGAPPGFVKMKLFGSEALLRLMMPAGLATPPAPTLVVPRMPNLG